MPIMVDLEPARAHAVVAEACRRRQSAEVRLQGRDGRQATAQTLLLFLSSQSIYVQRPTDPEGPLEVVSGETVLVNFNAEGRRFGLETLVRGSRTLRLGGEATVDAVELSLPQRVYELQRRTEYRVPLSGPAPVVAHFEPLPVDDDPDQPLAEPFHADLKNVCVGGLAALVDRSVRACLTVGQVYRVDFYLPGRDEPFVFVVSVQHILRLAHNDARLIGLRFLPDDDFASIRRSLREIRSFVDVHRRLKS